MSDTTVVHNRNGTAEREFARRPTASWRRQVLSALSWRNISAVYVLIAIVLIFSATIPDKFLTATTWRTLLDNQAVTGVAAVALVVPLAAGVFNLAIGLQVGIASIVVGWLLVKQGMPVAVAVPATALLGAAIGLVSGLLITKARIDSFIATLGVSSLLGACVTGISGGEQILGMPKGFSSFGTGEIGGITYPVLCLFAVCLVVWYLLERTPSGRRVYATGGNVDAARLTGVNTSLVIIGSLVACGILASFAGMLVTSKLANADPTLGPGYLLPAFTAVFLGSTQFKRGRFNVWGTVLSVYVLAAGVKGLQLSQVPVWIPDAFNGAALLVAVAAAKRQGALGRSSGLLARAVRRVRRTLPPDGLSEQKG
ncbi:ABC transporter permease [Streptomyces samsunensis]|uniref:ABC transporter permease n=1 Tax=Streptomyces malaysiensis TaxID=92644 RepID=A0ABX6WKG8_STRMQ|nr:MULTISPECIES: ABC transporter permease [Streptomyces]MYU16172.1 ABC transporter permease [Streptomyces sp. SID8361]MCD9592020.1 ABC transporter permease [Streptomyces sp. 8ZJF_21]NUH40216.1 ABC transporter permease [Streptomyces samsunensis]QDL68268.1 ABC transporter permease [Streptomyces malaysiensis]QPI61115.1 ABC transporter permease [Streptomyces solisilvae]